MPADYRKRSLSPTTSLSEPRKTARLDARFTVRAFGTELPTTTSPSSNDISEGSFHFTLSPVASPRPASQMSANPTNTAVRRNEVRYLQNTGRQCQNASRKRRLPPRVADIPPSTPINTHDPPSQPLPTADSAIDPMEDINKTSTPRTPSLPTRNAVLDPLISPCPPKQPHFPNTTSPNTLSAQAAHLTTAAAHSKQASANVLWRDAHALWVRAKKSWEKAAESKRRARESLRLADESSAWGGGQGPPRVKGMNGGARRLERRRGRFRIREDEREEGGGV